MCFFDIASKPTSVLELRLYQPGVFKRRIARPYTTKSSRKRR